MSNPGPGHTHVRNLAIYARILAAAVAVLMGARPVPAGPAKAPAPPAPPAFCTVSLSRVRHIQADGFDFEDDAGHHHHVRLACADCSRVADRLRGHAQTVARSILREEAVWVFPFGLSKGASEPTVRARVWTKKGWLAEVLVRAGYAMRRDAPEPSPLPAIKTAPAKSRPPCAPAFASATCTPAEADVFEVRRDGRPQQVRLFDVTCRNAPDPEAVASACSKAVGEKPVWVFPCGPAKGRDPTPARVWTVHGWLADRLVRDGLALRHPDPCKPEARAGAQTTSPEPAVQDPGPSMTEPPRGTEAVPGGPDKREIRWVDAGLVAAKVYRGSMPGAESKVFAVPHGVLRITWDCTPSREKSIVILNLYRVDDKWAYRTSSHHVHTLKGRRGRQALRVRPGRYWIKLSCSSEMKGVRVEVAEPAR